MEMSMIQYQIDSLQAAENPLTVSELCHYLSDCSLSVNCN